MHQFSSPILVRQWRENIITVCGQKSLLWSKVHTERRKASKNITEQLISGSAGQYNAMVKIQNKYNGKKNRPFVGLRMLTVAATVFCADYN